MTDEQPETWALLNEELRDRLSLQRAAFAKLETRASIVLGASLAAIQFVASQSTSSEWLAPAVVAYVVAVAASLGAVVPSRFDEISPRSTLTGLWLYPPGRAAAELANNRLDAFEKNVKRQDKLVQWVRVSVIAALLGAMMSVAHLTTGDDTDDRRDAPAVEADGPGSGSTGPGNSTSGP